MNITNIRNQINQHFKDKKEEYWKKRSKRKNSYWNKYYQSNDWQNLRNAYFYEHPCCEICEAAGFVTPAEHVHHIRPFGNAITEEAKWRLLLNPNNLMSLCANHHKLVHNIMKEKGLETVDIDTVLQYEVDKNNRMTLINNTN